MLETIRGTPKADTNKSVRISGRQSRKIWKLSFPWPEELDLIDLPFWLTYNCSNKVPSEKQR